jgi:HlyD family secretion protein
MKSLLLKHLLTFFFLGATVLAYPPLEHWLRTRNAPQYHTAKVVRGDIVSVVNATGTIKPVLSVRVGSFVSGPVAKLYVDYNTKVKKGGLLAEIDPTIHEAIRDRDKAALAVAKADVCRLMAQLQQASNDHRRATRIWSRGQGFITEAELDKTLATRNSLAAQLRMAEAQVKKAEANLKNSLRNLSFTKICSPVDGIVVDRKIDEGQTLVAQFLAPDLFEVALDLEKEILVHASIDDADVGLICEAQRRGNLVRFTVDAHPDDLFQGKIHQIRLNPTIKENVVTYNVTVSATNAELKLLPGMTAKLSFEIEHRTNVLMVPNAALRFYPKAENVREEDRKILEVNEEEATDNESGDKTVDARSATRRVLDHRQSNQRHLWVAHDGRLHAVAVSTGLHDYKYTEVVSGKFREGQELVTGMKK